LFAGEPAAVAGWLSQCWHWAHLSGQRGLPMTNRKRRRDQNHFPADK